MILQKIAQELKSQGLNGKVDILNMLPLAIASGLDDKDRTFAQIACLDVMPGLVALALGLETTAIRLVHVSHGASSAADGKITHPLTNLLCGCKRRGSERNGFAEPLAGFPRQGGYGTAR